MARAPRSEVSRLEAPRGREARAPLSKVSRLEAPRGREAKAPLSRVSRLEAPRGREAKKEDKRRRIRAAAAELFRVRGYDATTTRAIAERAGIATGTLFLYVRDKDEALALVYGDEVDEALAAGTKSRRPRLSFVRGTVHRLRGLYELYARHPALALRFVRRIPTLEDAEKSAHEARNERFVAVLRDEVLRAQRTSELRADLEVELATRTLFAVVRVLVFGWLSAPPVSVEGGLRELEAVLRLLVRGMGGGGSEGAPSPGSSTPTERADAKRAGVFSNRARGLEASARRKRNRRAR